MRAVGHVLYSPWNVSTLSTVLAVGVGQVRQHAARHAPRRDRRVRLRRRGPRDLAAGLRREPAVRWARRFDTCPFWTQVGKEAFGGRPATDGTAPRSSVWCEPSPPSPARAWSSTRPRWPRTFYCSATRTSTFRLVDLVRDSRGVAYSNQKRVLKLATSGEPTLLPRYGSAQHGTALRPLQRAPAPAVPPGGLAVPALPVRGRRHIARAGSLAPGRTPLSTPSHEARDLRREVATMAPGSPDSRELPVLRPSGQRVGVDVEHRRDLGRRHEGDRTARAGREAWPLLSRCPHRVWSGLRHGAPLGQCAWMVDRKAAIRPRDVSAVFTDPGGRRARRRDAASESRKRSAPGRRPRHVPRAGGPTLGACLRIRMMPRRASRRSLVPMCPQTPHLTGPIGPTQRPRSPGSTVRRTCRTHVRGPGTRFQADAPAQSNYPSATTPPRRRRTRSLCPRPRPASVGRTAACNSPYAS